MNWSVLLDRGMIWSAYASVILTGALALHSWRRREQPGAQPFAIACVFALAWSVGSVGQLLAPDPDVGRAWYVFRLVMLLPLVSAVTASVLQYAGLGRWLTRGVVLAAFVVPSAAFAVLAASNANHGLVWPQWTADAPGPATPAFGVAAWAAVACHAVLASVDLVVLLRLFVTSPARRGPVALMLVGVVFSRVAYGLELFAHGSSVTNDPEVAVVGVPLVLYAIGLQEVHVFGLVPQARQAVVDQMRDAVLVLDPARERIVYANPAAEALLRAPADGLRGRPPAQFLPPGALAGEVARGSVVRLPDDPVTLRTGTGEADDRRDVAVDATDLVDSSGASVGLLLLLRDVTQERRAFAERLDQQRALAAQRERDHLARELHDSVGQVLGYVSIQAQAAQKWLREGDVTRASGLLERLSEVARHAHDDVREAIISLKAVPEGEWTFGGSLLEFAGDFERQYGVRTTVTLTPDGAADPFDRTAGVQALRVVQEAMSNARRHGAARSVAIRVEPDGDEVRITVANDGTGFVAPPVDGQTSGHYGISFMRERMAEIGGTLTFSTGAKGATLVVLRVPVQNPQGGAT